MLNGFNNEDLNGHYEYVAMTSDGRPIYASASSTHYLFYDASCGDGRDAPWSSRAEIKHWAGCTHRNIIN